MNTELEHDGVLITKDGTEIWYENGMKHREDGPAVLVTVPSSRWYVDGRARAVKTERDVIEVEWWLDGVQFTSATQYQQETGATDMQMQALMRRYGGLK